jgi:hypothetical protein
MRRMPQVLRSPWVPFVTASLLFTVLGGALNGAWNLWSLHVLQVPVPVEHHQSHALAQMLGFMWLIKVGISLHLAPRLLGGQPPTAQQTRLIAYTGIGGVTFLVLGRFGSLLPGSAVFGLVGAMLLVASAIVWARFFWRLFLARPAMGDWLPQFVVSGATWWAFAAVATLLWQLGQTFGGPLAALPLDVVTMTGLFGGTGSCVLGITLRAGACSMRIERAEPGRQRVGYFVWQAGVVALLVKALFPFEAWSDALWLVPALSMAVMVWVVRPFQTPHDAPPGPEPLIRFAMVASWAFGLVGAGLFVWQAAALVGVGQPPFLRDAARHAFTLGFGQLGTLAFAARMVPGFEGVRLPHRAVFDGGVLAVTAGTALRLLSVFGPARWAMVASGVSGVLALVGVTLVSVSLWRAMRGGAVLRKELETARSFITVRVVA